MVQDPKQPTKGGEVRSARELSHLHLLTPPHVWFRHRTAGPACSTARARCARGGVLPPWRSPSDSVQLDQAGALDGNPEDLRGGKSEGKAFTGSARTLSGAPPAPPVEAPGPGPLQPIVHTISFYRYGTCARIARVCMHTGGADAARVCSFCSINRLCGE